MNTVENCKNWTQISLARGNHCWNCAKRNGFPYRAQPDKNCDNFLVGGQINLSPLTPKGELERLLIDMVKQYCVRTVRPDDTPETYTHDFISVGEEVFEYLVNAGCAEWCENGVDIFNLKYPKGYE